MVELVRVIAGAGAEIVDQKGTVFGHFRVGDDIKERSCGGKADRRQIHNRRAMQRGFQIAHESIVVFHIEAFHLGP
jgi:hypothetical protein